MDTTERVICKIRELEEADFDENTGCFETSVEFYACSENEHMRIDNADFLFYGQELAPMLKQLNVMSANERCSTIATKIESETQFIDSVLSGISFGIKESGPDDWMVREIRDLFNDTENYERLKHLAFLKVLNFLRFPEHFYKSKEIRNLFA